MAGKISELVSGAPAIVSDLAADTAALETSIDINPGGESDLDTEFAPGGTGHWVFLDIMQQ